MHITDGLGLSQECTIIGLILLKNAK